MCLVCTCLRLMINHCHGSQACAEFLLPLQPMLAEACSPAGRQALYDVLDWSVPRALFNAPYLQPLELEIFKVDLPPPPLDSSCFAGK